MKQKRETEKSSGPRICFAVAGDTDSGEAITINISFILELETPTAPADLNKLLRNVTREKFGIRHTYYTKDLGDDTTRPGTGRHGSKFTLNPNPLRENDHHERSP